MTIKFKHYDFAPNQQKLKIARTEIEAVLAKHDLAGVVVLHTPGMSEFFYNVAPSYSVLRIDDKAGSLHVRSKLADFGGDKEKQLRSNAASANMVAAFADNLACAHGMFHQVQGYVDDALQAMHVEEGFVPDPNESKLQ